MTAHMLHESDPDPYRPSAQAYARNGHAGMRRKLDAKATRFAAIKNIPLWAKIFVVAYPFYMLSIELRFLRDHGLGGFKGVLISCACIPLAILAAYYFPYALLDEIHGGKVLGENPRDMIDRWIGWGPPD